MYNFRKAKWVQGTWSGIDAVIKNLKTDQQLLPFAFTRVSGRNFGVLMFEYVYTQIVNFERQLFKAHDNQKIKVYDKACLPYFYRSVAQLKIGLVGIGSMGKEMAKLFNQLGCTSVYGFGRRSDVDLNSEEYKHLAKYYSRNSLSKMVSSVDYLVSALPKTEETDNILGNGVLENCKGKNVVFVNVGRGNVIKEVELVQALKEKWISGAILDVFEVEPLSKDSELWTLPNVVITPHVAANTQPPEIAAQFKINLERYLKNEPLMNQIDFSKGY